MSIETQVRLICDECEESVEIEDILRPKLPKGWKKDYDSDTFQTIWGHLCPECYKSIREDEKEN